MPDTLYNNVAMSAGITNTSSGRATEVSWVLLLCVASLLVIALHLLGYIVVYTEGEVMQALFRLLIWVVGGLVLVGFGNRKLALWGVLLLGGLLLLWQAFQIRKWAMIHEEVVAMIQFAEAAKTQKGSYPGNLEGYDFKNSWVKAHLGRYVSDETNGMVISYFMNDPGITYWYASKSGFGYYPD